MRSLLLVFLIIFSLASQAGQTPARGTAGAEVGDTAIHAIALPGTPDCKEPVQNKFGATLGERWQYARDNGHVGVVTIIAGKVTDIDDRRS